MNPLQRKILVGGIVLAVLVCVYACVFTLQPQTPVSRITAAQKTNGSWTYFPPDPPADNQLPVARLALEVLAVAGLTGVGLLMAGWRKSAAS